MDTTMNRLIVCINYGEIDASAKTPSDSARQPQRSSDESEWRTISIANNYETNWPARTFRMRRNGAAAAAPTIAAASPAQPANSRTNKRTHSQ